MAHKEPYGFQSSTCQYGRPGKDFHDRIFLGYPKSNANSLIRQFCVNAFHLTALYFSFLSTYFL
jgi:hypothetical protein